MEEIERLLRQEMLDENSSMAILGDYLTDMGRPLEGEAYSWMAVRARWPASVGGRWTWTSGPRTDRPDYLPEAIARHFWGDCRTEDLVALPRFASQTKALEAVAWIWQFLMTEEDRQEARQWT